LKLFRGIIL